MLLWDKYHNISIYMAPVFFTQYLSETNVPEGYQFDTYS